MDDEKKDEKKEGKKLKKIKPLKDFCFFHNGDLYDLKKGEEVELPEIFLPNLKTEKVIK